MAGQSSKRFSKSFDSWYRRINLCSICSVGVTLTVCTLHPRAVADLAVNVENFRPHLGSDRPGYSLFLPPNVQFLSGWVKGFSGFVILA